MDVVSYRVLGYLLLGIVRIYSRKVEYALDDCKEMLINVNKFVDNREDFAHVETLRICVSIPERLQLDAFELDVLEDTGKDHTALPEEITIRDKEVVCKTGDFGLFSQEKGFSVPLLENLFNDSTLKTSNVDRAQEQRSAGGPIVGSTQPKDSETLLQKEGNLAISSRGCSCHNGVLIVTEGTKKWCGS
ncbi:hypothetical protein LR48_Vigan03g182600 [Vigna angularis]|uniref:Rad21/Rec8-like protein N-terminal domain-containing protein n=1 Tax=Phaseolus angularis TaxID=3914 RepID=A0A0L9U7N4_PHAAN|nr:hypothetical protein LR48_Vigan03g182600 [Vigna angularis]